MTGGEGGVAENQSDAVWHYRFSLLAPLYTVTLSFLAKRKRKIQCNVTDQSGAGSGHNTDLLRSNFFGQPINSSRFHTAPQFTVVFVAPHN